MLFVPTYKESIIQHGIESNADSIILDLEDSIPDQFKPIARQNVKKFIDAGAFKNVLTFVRINPIESELLFEDLKYIMHEDIDGFVLTKVYNADDMVYYDKIVTQLEAENGLPDHHFAFAPLIETTSAVMDIHNITKSTSRNIALSFGGEDFLNDLEGLHGEPPISFNYPKAIIALAARAAGMLPIDTPYLSLNDFEGFEKEKSAAFEMGFAGCLLIHPKQIELSNKCFTPSAEEVKRSIEIVEAINKSKITGSGAAMLDKKMIGPPMGKRAKSILNLIKLIKDKQNNSV